MAFLLFMLVFLAIGAAVVYGVVKLIGKNAVAVKKKQADVSATLLPMIAGEANGDRFTGTYAGRPVAAYAREQRDPADMDSSNRSMQYYFVTSMHAGPGISDWEVTFMGDKLMGMAGVKAWHVKTHDKALEARLIDAGALDCVAHVGEHHPAFVYNAKTGDVYTNSPMSVHKVYPDGATFKTNLEALAALAACNAKANVATIGA
ncbi:MAG: hypothetical protein NVSMB5_17390 [Candidatus Velthaea sp.]